MDGRKIAGRWVAPAADASGERSTPTLDRPSPATAKATRATARPPARRRTRRPRGMEDEPRSINSAIFVLIGIGLALGAICAFVATLLLH
jgi:hypothetical protein